MGAAMDQNERPQYYEGQYLGAEDLAAIVRFARNGQARHALGAHTWGIGIGFELVERTLPGGDVEITLTPGYACDGIGRNLVALAPTKIGLTQFENFQDPTDPTGTPLEIWISYHELPARAPGEGFASCREDSPYARVVESFRVEIRRPPVSEYRGVAVAGRTIDARAAISAFKSGGAPLYDETVPYQELPDSGDRPRWALFIGIVRWVKAVNQSGRLIKRSDDDLNATRRGRRYLGAVAEVIHAPDGVLRLRDRTKDPDDSTLNFKTPLPKPAPGVVPDNDLVWVEGSLRVIGDARLVAGKLDFRVERGGNDDIPMWLRRIKDTSTPTGKITLEACIGPPTVPHTETRFAVSEFKLPATSVERLTVITDGRVGINAPAPTNSLQVSGPTGIRQGVGYLSGDEGGGWASLSVNAYYKAGDKWQFPDPLKNAASVRLDETGGVPAIKMMTNVNADPAKWDLRIVIKGDSGNVGIGEPNPSGLMHLAKQNLGYLKLFSSGGDIEYDGGVDKLFVFKDNGGTTAFMGSRFGFNTAAPQTTLHVIGNRIRLGDDTKRIDLRVDGTDVDLHSTTHHLFIRTQGNPGKRHVLINPDNATEGNVGIGTAAPAYKLDVNGAMHVSGTAHKDTLGGWVTPSDLALKKDVSPLKGALGSLLKLKGVEFAWRAPERHGANAGRYTGFIAQDVEKIFPQWVETTETGIKALNPVGLDALMVEALRELNARCTKLEAELKSVRERSDRKAATENQAIAPTAVSHLPPQAPRPSRRRKG
ncbi:MAG: hypothetical protein JWN94_4331 [Betaproteobacteria bacterium]|nr:hypothetical protein [Betaproteobacteria bacterium]